ncbi:MAG: glycosyltransferase [Pseudobutyrivibrio sp.]|nr:glycosyltransferase [Pseudobutyrivibrio sp.]MCF0184974.1 glycosyltransferase [Bacteroidaceae bacterium]
MKILMVVNWYTTKGNDKIDVGTFHYDQSMNLIEHGCEVAIYYPHDENLEEPESCEVEWGLLTYRTRLNNSDKRGSKKQRDLTFERIMREFKPDVIHAHCAVKAGLYAVKWAKEHKLPLMVTEHWQVELSHMDRFGIAWAIGRYVYGKSKANVCVSPDLQRKLSNIYKGYEFQVIYNGTMKPENLDPTNDYRVPDCVNASIVASFWDKESKGFQFLLPALKSLKDKGTKIMIHHLGGGQYLDYYKQMTADLGVEDCIRFYGPQDHKVVYEVMNQMDFCISASLNETAGVTMQEAILLAKPVLGTKSGGVNSLVPEGAGLIVDKGSAKALEDGISYMISNLDSFDREWIKNYGFNHFEIGHISEKYIQVYTKLCEKGY